MPQPLTHYKCIIVQHQQRAKEKYNYIFLALCKLHTFQCCIHIHTHTHTPTACGVQLLSINDVHTHIQFLLGLLITCCYPASTPFRCSTKKGKLKKKPSKCHPYSTWMLSMLNVVIVYRGYKLCADLNAKWFYL